MSEFAARLRDLGLHDKSLALNRMLVDVRSRSLGSDDRDTLSSMHHVASGLRELGSYRESEELLRKLIEARSRALGPLDRDTLWSVGSLVQTLIKQNRLDEAYELNERLLRDRESQLEIEKQAGLDGAALVASSAGKQLLRDYFSSLEARAQMVSRREPHTDKALRLHSDLYQKRKASLGDADHDTLRSLGFLAGEYSRRGEFDQGLRLEEENYSLRVSSLGSGNTASLTSGKYLADRKLEIGQADEAIELLINIDQGWSRRLENWRAHPKKAEIEFSLAKAFRLKRDLPKALSHALSANALLGSIDHGRNTTSPEYLASLNLLGSIYRDKDMLDLAISYHQQALEGRQKVLGENHPDTLYSMGSLSGTYSKVGRLDDAIQMSARALALKLQVLGQFHTETISSYKHHADLLVRLDRIDEALSMMNTVVDSVEELRKRPFLDGAKRQTLFSGYSDLYKSYSSTLARYGQNRLGFEVGDMSKARTLGDELRSQTAFRLLPVGEQTLLDELRTSVRAAAVGLDDLRRQEGIAPNELVVASERLSIAQRNYSGKLASLKESHVKFAQLLSSQRPRVQRAELLLKASEIFISYIVDSDGRARVWILGNDGNPQLIELGKISDLAEAVQSYRSLCAKAASRGRLYQLESGAYVWRGHRDGGETSITDSASKARLVLGNWLHSRLIRPIMPFVSKYQHWTISPDRELALLPFDVLMADAVVDGKTDSATAQVSTITMVQSFSVFELLKERQSEYAQSTRAKALLAVGNPVFASVRNELCDRGRSRYSARTPTRIEPMTGQKLSVQEEQTAMLQLQWCALPGTQYEVEATSKVFDGESISLLGKDATEGRLNQLSREGDLKRYRYLLFSTHGYLAQNPGLSSIVLSLVGNRSEDDGYLTASEWPLYEIQSDLTVLSACDSGVGRILPGEGLLGLPYALFVAGNVNTLLTLWPVDDTATSVFMVSFFEKLKVGMSQPQALAETKSEFAHSARWHHPSYWAAFVLYGV